VFGCATRRKPRSMKSYMTIRKRGGLFCYLLVSMSSPYLHGVFSRLGELMFCPLEQNILHGIIE
jgi:hypothetical protein